MTIKDALREKDISVVLNMTIADIKYILNREIVRKKTSGCYDIAAAIEYALEVATEHWDEYNYKDDFVIHRDYN